jgi:hypothetical protein
MKNEHTPGPWKNIALSVYGPDIIDKRSKPIAKVGGKTFCLGEAEVFHANARLIAAAPDLLEACKEALEKSHDPVVEKILMRAITKAEGV